MGYYPAMSTIPLAFGLVYVPHFVKMIIVCKETKDYPLEAPRELDVKTCGKSSDMVSRCVGCHQNGFESFLPFATAVLLRKVQKANPIETLKLCFRYLVLRLIYTGFYIGGVNKAI